MADTWQDDWEIVTEGWHPLADADKYAAIARMFHAAHAEGRIAHAEGREMEVPAPYRPGLRDAV